MQIEKGDGAKLPLRPKTRAKKKLVGKVITGQIAPQITGGK